MYFSDDGEVMAVRVGDYKFNLAVQRATKMMQWAEPLVKLRIPLIFNLRRDPFECADVNSNTYFDWMVDHVPQLYLMQATVAAQIENFASFPPRQKPASFNLDAVLAQVSSARRPAPDFGGFLRGWRATASSHRWAVAEILSQRPLPHQRNVGRRDSSVRFINSRLRGLIEPCPQFTAHLGRSYLDFRPRGRKGAIRSPGASTRTLVLPDGLWAGYKAGRFTTPPSPPETSTPVQDFRPRAIEPHEIVPARHRRQAVPILPSQPPN